MDTSFIWAVSSRLDSLLCLDIICEFDVNQSCSYICVHIKSKYYIRIAKCIHSSTNQIIIKNKQQSMYPRQQ